MDHTTTSEVTPADLSSVESLLDDLDMGAIVNDEPVVETIGELEGDELRELEAGLVRDASYAEQEDKLVLDAEAPAAAAAAKPEKKARGAKTPKVAGAPRTPKDLASVPAEFFVNDPTIVGDPTLHDIVKAEMIAKLPPQKKIAEKFEQLFGALAAGKKPSVYTTIAFKLLDEKMTISGADLVAALKAADYTDGTARSQAGQMMNLFDVVGIAARTGQSLTLNVDSQIAARLRAIVA